ncbi:energy transducer TonB [Prevotella sp.]|uniref:energy transducer TonB n=1 Tax=Prevotella sp. TaxID=59823 RepID=UPI002F95DCDA
MDIKKSKTADLEQKRTTYFLLGIVLVLMLFLTLIEYSGHDNPTALDEELFDDMSEDIEFLPAHDKKDMIAVVPRSAPAASPTIKPVDTPTNLSKKIAAATTDRLIEGQTDGSPSKAEESKNEEEPAPVAIDTNDNPLNFRIIEQLPEFPGGMVAFMQWLTQNLNYPPLAQRQRIEGKVVVSFIINKDGSISDAKIAKSANPLLDREALRIVGIMPKWKPGMQDNKPCRTMFAIPINFKL